MKVPRESNSFVSVFRQINNNEIEQKKLRQDKLRHVSFAWKCCSYEVWRIHHNISTLLFFHVQIGELTKNKKTMNNFYHEANEINEKHNYVQFLYIKCIIPGKTDSTNFHFQTVRQVTPCVFHILYPFHVIMVFV